MTMPTSPGAPPSDVMAVEQLRTLIEDTTATASHETEDSDGYQAFALSPEQARAALMNEVASVVFERDVNAAGVPVRRLVARTEWHLDPHRPMHHARRGDVVCFAEHEDGQIETRDHGTIPPGQEWIVRSVLHTAVDPADDLLLIKLADWPDSSFISAAGDQVVIVRRPAGV